MYLVRGQPRFKVEVFVWREIGFKAGPHGNILFYLEALELVIYLLVIQSAFPSWLIQNCKSGTYYYVIPLQQRAAKTAGSTGWSPLRRSSGTLLTMHMYRSEAYHFPRQLQQREKGGGPGRLSHWGIWGQVIFLLPLNVSFILQNSLPLWFITKDCGAQEFLCIRTVMPWDVTWYKYTAMHQHKKHVLMWRLLQQCTRTCIYLLYNLCSFSLKPNWGKNSF